MYFIGDIHGKTKEYFKIIKELPKSIQVGDFGFGFQTMPSDWDSNHKFIRGNHDDPSACNLHPNYLGDYGITDDGIFYVGGGYSIDYKWRQVHNYANPNEQVWWEDEEIAESEFPKILEMYEKEKPEIVVAHDAPEHIQKYLVEGNSDDKRRFINRTCHGLLPAMIEIHKPKIWIFGHYHTDEEIIIDGVRYKCLDELEVFEYDDNQRI